MELPFYLMAQGEVWDGVVSLRGRELHFELKEAHQGAMVIDVPVQEIDGADFLRGLVGRRISIRVRQREMLDRFPAGVNGQEVELLVAREDPCFGDGRTEQDYEEFVGELRRAACATTEGLAN